MSSGTAMTGWVSLSWKMTRSGSRCRSKSLRQHLVDEVAHRAGDEEVLLLQAQLLALRRGVLGVEHHRDLLGEGLVAHGLDVVAGVELGEVEGAGRLGAPQPQRVDAPVAVAGDHVVVGHAEDVPVRTPSGCARAVVVGVLLGAAAELHAHGVLGVRELPRVAELQPRVGVLDLPAVDERLAEDAVLVADAVADAGHRHRRERVDEAGREPAQSAVAEARLDLLPAQGAQRDAQLPEALLDDVVHVGGEQRVVELPAQEVLRREVADRLGLHVPLLGQRGHPPGLQVVAHGAREREVLVVDRAARQADALPVVELAHEVADEAVDRMRGGGEVSTVQTGTAAYRCVPLVLDVRHGALPLARGYERSGAEAEPARTLAGGLTGSCSRFSALARSARRAAREWSRSSATE